MLKATLIKENIKRTREKKGHSPCNGHQAYHCKDPNNLWWSSKAPNSKFQIVCDETPKPTCLHIAMKLKGFQINCIPKGQNSKTPH
jgi:hypothetical protein